ncbi:MAG: helix-turn-helix domain-containing protein [Dehalococcoidia bacterium]
MAEHASGALHIPGDFWSRAQIREALRRRDIAALFHLLKQYAGASQTKIGTAVGLEQGYVSKVMTGRRAITAIDVLERIADGCAMPDESRVLLGLAPNSRRRRPQRPSTADSPLTRPTLVESQIPHLRQVLDAYDLPPDGPTRPLHELRQVIAAVVSKRLHSNYVALAFELPPLLSELMRAWLSSTPQDRLVVARLLAQAYRAADAIADKYGYYDLSARFIERLHWAATESHDALLLATASYVRTEIFFANGDLGTGQRMLERAVATLAPQVSSRAAAVYGSLHMRAAVTAARAGDAVRARDHMADANRWARDTAEGVYFGTAFGRASVKIHRLALAVELRDVDSALRIAGSWTPPRAIPAERRSHYYVDLARAHMQAGHRDKVLDSLMVARTIAPEHIQNHPQVRDMLRLAQTAGPQTARLTELRRFVRVTDARI